MMSGGVSSNAMYDPYYAIRKKYGEEFLEKYITYLVGKAGFEGNLNDPKNARKLDVSAFKIDSPELKKYLMDLL